MMIRLSAMSSFTTAFAFLAILVPPFSSSSSLFFVSAGAVRGRGQTEAALEQRKRRHLQSNTMISTTSNNMNVSPGFATLGQLYDYGGSANSANANANSNSNTNTNANIGNDNNQEVPEQQQTAGSSPNAVCRNGQPAEYVDVIIIGAGMAGIQAAATLRAQDPTLTYAILESTDRVGGRVRSVDFAGRKVEDGANWIIDFPDNPMMSMAQSAVPSYRIPVHEWSDYVTYDENGSLMDQKFVMDQEKRLMKAWSDAEKEADNQWSKDHESYPDNGVNALLTQQGWEVQSNLDYTFKWFMLDYEYADSDTSVRYFPYLQSLPAHHVNDPRGYEFLLQTHFQNNVDTSALRTSSRVSTVHYDENVVSETNGKTYKVVVNTNAENGSGCKDYYAQRIISTVSAGVINNDLIKFNPPLAFPAQDFSPYYMTQYIKIFYQFQNQFWDENQFIRTVRDEANRGHCHHWSNFNAAGFEEGSNIIRCEIMTEAFNALIDPVTQDLEEATLLALLEPLRKAYGAEAVGTPIDIHYPKMNKDRDWGYGGYANWKIGSSFTQFAHMYGGVEDLVPYCEHNGCNANGEWTMMISGSATCYNWAEFVHGAYFAGEKAARNVLRELGYDVPTVESPCDADTWVWLK